MHVVKTYFFLVVLIILGSIAANHNVQGFVVRHMDDLIVLDASIDRITRNSGGIKPIDDHRFTYTRVVDYQIPFDFDTQMGLSMIIGGIAADGYVIELNNEVIYSAGDMIGDGANIWYNYYLVSIPSTLINSQNTLAVTVNSDEYISSSKYPVYIGKHSVISGLYNMIAFLTNSIFIILVAFNLFILFINFSNAKFLGKKWGRVNRYLSYSLFALAIFLTSFMKIDNLFLSNNYFAMLTNSMMVVSVMFIIIVMGRIRFSLLGWLIGAAGGIVNLYGILMVLLADQSMILYYDYFIRALIVLIIGGLLLVAMNYLSHVEVEELDQIILIGMGGIAFLAVLNVSDLFNSGYAAIDFFSSGMILYDITLVYWILTFNRRHVSRIMEDRNSISETASIYKEQSTIDDLTKLFNRHALSNRLDSLNEQASVIFLDIDDFKLINDVFGHKVGDTVLSRIGAIIEGLTPGDGYRYGGEELVVLVDGIDGNEALTKAETLRRRIQDDAILRSLVGKSITVSLGVASYPESTDDIKKLVDKGDIAMYYAKNSGKNKSHKYNNEALDFYSSLKYVSQENKMLYTIMHASLDAMDEIDDHMKEHISNVAKYAESMGKYLSLDMNGLFTLTTGAYIHDIGKIALSEGQLVDIDYVDPAYKLHNELGYEILWKLISEDDAILSIVRNHHERYDGKGFPDGLAGETIPYFTRIVALLNAYEHYLTKDKSVNKDIDKALAKIKAESGRRFDPTLVEAFEGMLGHSDYRQVFEHA